LHYKQLLKIWTARAENGLTAMKNRQKHTTLCNIKNNARSLDGTLIAYTSIWSEYRERDIAVRIGLCKDNNKYGG
jgi:hypothetical protein